MLLTLRRLIFRILPRRSALLREASQRYIDRYNADNDSNPARNGEQWLVRRVLPMVSNGAVFDVGANVGEWSSFCLAVAPQIELHLFEPSAATFRILHQSNWPGTVFLNNIGVGEKQEKLALHVASEGSGLVIAHLPGFFRWLERAQGVQ